MSSCCSNSKTPTSAPTKHPCPKNNKDGVLVPTSTIYHHLKQPWKWQAQDQAYYFCDDPDCDVVYFSEDNSIIEENKLRTKVGIKTQADNDLICYCYGVSLNEAKQDTSIKDFVIKMTKQNSCACETRNPSGRCCLKDFPKGS